MSNDDTAPREPDDRQSVDVLLQRWEQAYNQGQVLSANDLCPNGSDELLREIEEGIECLKIFQKQFAVHEAFHVTQFRASGYEATEVIGEGGQGTVLLAEENCLDRKVALKILKEPCLHDDALTERLRQEAKIAGTLEHPGVIPVYGLGTDSDGKPFYTMRYVPRKQRLQNAIDDTHAISDPSEFRIGFQRLLHDFVSVCRTIEYAHSKNVIHRDIKPTNILIGDYGEVFVIDFGLAKPLTRIDAKTKTGAVANDADPVLDSSRTIGPVGTPAYMSPEQVKDAGRVGTPSDIYSLGATLYHLLTGRAPFIDHKTMHDLKTGLKRSSILDRVCANEFRPPRHLNPSVPPPLEAVCLKAMSLESQDRYKSAGDLADEIERWIADEPVTAWREPVSVRARRWMKRHRTLVTAFVAALVVAVVVACVAATLIASKNRQLTVDSFLLRFPIAFGAWDDGDVRRAQELLSECPSGPGSIELALLKQFVAGERNIPVPHNPLFIQCRLNVLAVVMDEAIMLVDDSTGRVQKTVHDTDGSWEPSTFALSPDAKSVVLASASDNQFRVWNLNTSKVICRLDPVAAPRRAIFIDAGKTIVTASTRKYAEVIVQRWDATTGQCRHTATVRTNEGVTYVRYSSLDEDDAQVEDLAFNLSLSEDGRWLAIWPQTSTAPVASTINSLRIFDTANGELKCTIVEPEPINKALMSPDGCRVATFGLGTKISIWDTETGNGLQTLEGHRDQVVEAAFHQDGSRLASGDKDGGIKIWDIESGRETGRLRGHTALIVAMSFLADGRLATSGGRGNVTIWELAAGPRIIKGEFGWVSSMQFAPDGDQIVWAAEPGQVGVARLNGQIIVDELPSKSIQVAVSQSGNRMVTCDLSNVYVSTVGRDERSLAVNDASAPVAISRDGKLVAALSTKETPRKDWPPIKSGTTNHPLLEDQRNRVISVPEELLNEPRPLDRTIVMVIDGRTGKVKHQFENHDVGVVAMAFNFAADRLAVWDRTNTVSIWDVTSESVVQRINVDGKIPGYLRFGRKLQFSPKGRTLATVGNDKKIRIWELETGRLSQVIDGHTDFVIDISYTPDSLRLVSASFDGTIRIWDAVTGVHLLTLGTDRQPNAIAISSDGSRLAVGCCDDESKSGELLIFDAYRK